MRSPDNLTPAETAAIRDLERLAARWPKSLRLFSRNGTLEVQFNDGSPPNEALDITFITGIPNDGGDT